MEFPFDLLSGQFPAKMTIIHSEEGQEERACSGFLKKTKFLFQKSFKEKQVLHYILKGERKEDLEFA